VPGWLQARPNYSVWQRNNRWILHHAFATTADRVSVLALWNGLPGDGPGGVAGMVAAAQASGAEVITVDCVELFGLEEPGTADDPPGEEPAHAPDGSLAQARSASPADRTQGAPAAAGVPEAASGDRPLDLVWRRHRLWSKAADAAHATLDRWRRCNLALLVLGALAGALAVQDWLPAHLATASALTAAVALALAGLVQTTALTPTRTAHWTAARAASEALKAETYRYLIGVQPYADTTRDQHLLQQLDRIRAREQSDLLDRQQLTTEDLALPQARTFGSYLTTRAQRQADWHRTRSTSHARTAGRLRAAEAVATAVGAALAAAGGVLAPNQLAAWTAAATTIAAAFATHLAAGQLQRIASSYAATADQLDRLVAGIDPVSSGPDEQARFVADVERVLAAQNDGWVDLLSTAPGPSADSTGPATALAAA
jgi:cytochrome c551/c552